MAFLHNDKEQFADAINLAAYQTGMMAQAVEKDYYVSLILRRLAQRISFVVFKGGTSLSKCHNVIRRFSEDIDITIDSEITQGQKKRVKDTIVEIAAELGMVVTNLDETHSRRDYNRYIIAYPTVLPIVNDAVQPAVLLETSFKTISFPTVELPVRSYIGTMMESEAPDLIKDFELEPFSMKVQGLDRTLADKIFAICDYYLQDSVSKHSRYLYDIHMLLPLVPMDAAFHKLMQEVRNDRKASPVCVSAQDNIDIPTVLQQIITENVYRSDYNNLTMHLLEEPIAYERVIDSLRQVAAQLQKIQSQAASHQDK